MNNFTKQGLSLTYFDVASSLDLTNDQIASNSDEVITSKRKCYMSCFIIINYYPCTMILQLFFPSFFECVLIDRRFAFVLMCTGTRERASVCVRACVFARFSSRYVLKNKPLYILINSFYFYCDLIFPFSEYYKFNLF